MKTKHSIFFYGWVIVATSILLTAIGLGAYISTNSVFVKPVCDELDFARGEFTFHRTIISLVSAALMPLYGKLIQRCGVKKVLLLGAVLSGLIMFGYSFSTKLWHFYVLALFNGALYNAISFLSIGVLVRDWFHARQGLATGLAYCGSGLGASLMIPVANSIIERYDWRAAYAVIGIGGVLIMVPIVLLLIKNKPEEMGLQPLQNSLTVTSPTTAPDSGMMMGEALRTGRFWMLAVAFFLINAMAGGVNTHTMPYLNDIGYTTQYASSVVSVIMLFLTAGKILLGSVYDKFGAMKGNLIVLFFMLGYPILSLLAPYHTAFPWLYGIFSGIACCAVSVPVSILTSRHFGSKDFATVFGFFTMISTFAPSISVPLMGTVYDLTGSYRPAWIVFVGGSIVVAVMMIGAELIYKRKTA